MLLPAFLSLNIDDFCAVLLTRNDSLLLHSLVYIQFTKMQTYTYVFHITFLMRFMLVPTPKQKLFKYVCNRFRNGHYNNGK